MKRSTNHKNIYVIMMTILIPLIAVTSACGVSDGQAIKDTVSGFFTSYENREFSRCLEFFSQRLRDSRGDSNLVDEMQSDRFWLGNARLRSMGEPSIEGRTAIIWVDYEGLLGQVNTIQLTLIKESRTWKIDDY